MERDIRKVMADLDNPNRQTAKKLKQQDLPVHLLVPLREDLKTIGDSTDNKPSAVDVAIKSDIMESYDNAQPLDNNGEIVSLMDQKRGLQVFSIGEDKHLYRIQKSKEGKAFWENHDISQKLSKMETVYVTFDIFSVS